jgi:phosphoglycerate dehydrogenase-like enzyme/glyoxylase-like metal-dependent hydrolase (beta-lactamase superfamily II)
MRRSLSLLALFVAASALNAQEIPKLKFNEVRQIAPGVFFRYSQISATDKSVVFGGSNNIWIVFDDYVLVYDANFPKEAGDVIEAIKKTTDKPIRYVLDSHHHGDHAYGNAVFAKAGATVVAQTRCGQLLRVNGPKEFADAGKGKGGRKDVAESFLKVPDLMFDEKLVFDDGKGQRAEMMFLGHAHTAGDAFLYLPKHKILCTGDACTNGPFNYMGHSDSASWIRVLDKAQQLDVKIVCPGHGPLGGKDVLAKQQRYFRELREQVAKGIAAGKEFDDIHKSIDMPWHKEWTEIEANTRSAETRHVFDELTGRVTPADLIEDFGVYEGPSPTKESAGWARPKRIVVPALMPAKLQELKIIAPDVLFVPVKDASEAAREAGDADAVLGFCTEDIVNANPKLRWIQVAHAGVEKDLAPAVVKSNVVVTNTARLYGPNVADQAMALLLGLTRGMAAQVHKDATPIAARVTPPNWDRVKNISKADELHGKTILVVGLGGIGTQIARRADAFGMRVMAIDPGVARSNGSIKATGGPGRGLLSVAPMKPDFVFSVDGSEKFMELLPKADVVVLACPLTAETKVMMGLPQFKAMKPTAQFINIARGGLVRSDDLVAALEQKLIAGAGLDVTDPEPLPDSSPLWKMPNVAISPHVGPSPEGRDRQWRLFRENVRRFVAGEPLLCVVDKAKGY